MCVCVGGRAQYLAAIFSHDGRYLRQFVLVVLDVDVGHDVGDGCGGDRGKGKDGTGSGGGANDV